VGARVIGAARVGRLRGSDAAEGLLRRGGLAHPGGILGRAAEHEVVLHEGRTRGNRARGDELLLGLRRVGEQQIRVALGPQAQSRTRSHRHHTHADAGALAEGRKQRAEESGITHTGGGGEQHRLVAGRRGHRPQREPGEERDEASPHFSPPF